MQKRITGAMTSFVTVLGSALLTVIVLNGVLFYLNRSGVNAFAWASGMTALLQPIMRYLGYAVFFFLPILGGYVACFLRLKQSLSRYPWDPLQEEKIRFYSGAMEIFITLFFAVGVIFTAWGLQNALVSALAGIGKTEAGRLGAWGILKRLVDNGILIALWTTIVGGTGGYLMRMAKYFFLGKQLNRYAQWRRGVSESRLIDTLASIRRHVEGIERSVRSHEEEIAPPQPHLTVGSG